MQNKHKLKEKSGKYRMQQDLSGSQTVGEKIKRKIPWVLGGLIRKPKIQYPKLKNRNISLSRWNIFDGLGGRLVVP